VRGLHPQESIDFVKAFFYLLASPKTRGQGHRARRTSVGHPGWLVQWARMTATEREQ
jgi:hypothetical protein